MIKTFEVQLLPNEDQIVLFKQHCGSVRWLWNQMLDLNIKKYEADKQFVFRFEMSKLLPELKATYPWLSETNSQSLQEQVINLNNAITRKIKNKKAVGFPKFKSKHTSVATFAVPQHFNICNRSIKLPKIGRIKYNKQREFEGKAKRIVVKCVDDKWFGYITCELPDVPVRNIFTEQEVIGIDVGIKDFAVLNTGVKYSNPKHLQKSEKLLKHKQKSLSKKVKGSSNRTKAKKKLNKLHRHVANQRKDFQWKLVSSITKNYQVVCMEDLNIKGMVQNRKLAKSISSASWGLFKTKLQHKLAETGGILVEIDRYSPSSKMCSSCGTVNNNLTLNDREWDCECGVKHDRDINAAVNIRSFGLSELYRLGTSRIYACRDIDSNINETGIALPLGDPTCSLDKW
jgi:putative transposase